MDFTDEAATIFQEWLLRRTGFATDPAGYQPATGNLDRYVAAHGLPDIILSEPRIRVAAYQGRFVGEVRGTGAVLVCESGPHQ